MKKTSTLIVVISLVAFLLAGCGGSGSTSSGQAAGGKTYDVVFGTHLIPGTILITVAESMITMMSERTNGRFRMTLSHSGQLGSQREILEAVNRGVIDISSAASGTLMAFNLPEGAILNLPYIFDNDDHFMRARHAFIPAIEQSLTNNTNFVVLFCTPNGFRHVFLNRPARSLAGMRGMKVRTPENRGIINAIRAIGANPTPIPSGEMYSAIQTGVVDGMENNFETIYQFKIHEVTQYGVLTQHVFIDEILFANKNFVASLDPDDRRIFMEVSEIGGQMYADHRTTSESEYRKMLEDLGIEFIDVDLAEFRNSAGVQELWNEVIATLPAARSIIDAINAVR